MDRKRYDAIMGPLRQEEHHLAGRLAGKTYAAKRLAY